MEVSSMEVLKSAACELCRAEGLDWPDSVITWAGPMTEELFDRMVEHLHRHVAVNLQVNVTSDDVSFAIGSD